jgi:hypothetical protein
MADAPIDLIFLNACHFPVRSSQFADARPARSFSSVGAVRVCEGWQERLQVQAVVPVGTGNVHGHGTRARTVRAEHQILHPTSTRHNSTNTDPIQAAIEAYEAQGPEGQYSVQEVANQHGVRRSTMQRRMDGQSVPRSDYISNSRKLSPQQEDELVEYLKSLTACRLPPTRAMVQTFASEIARNQISERWVSRFLI